MPPIPVSKFTEMLLSRRKLFEKIVQHVASKKIQNSIQATGDRMSVTPQQFGMQVGKTMGKQAALILPSMGIGAGLGVLSSPAGHRMEGAGRGAAKGTGAGLGATLGAPIGAAGALALSLMSPRAGKALFGPSSRQLGNYFKTLARNVKLKKPLQRVHITAENRLQLLNTLGGAGAAGAAGGAGLGYAGASAAMGEPSWANKQSSMLGGALGAGVGGMAGGVGGGLLGAMTGGAMGGAPGAGLGLLSGGAMGLGAGAHLGGNIGASIGKKKKKDDEPKEESAENEEKSDDTNKEKEMDKHSTHDIVKNASVVLAQLRKNAADPRMYAADAGGSTPPMTGVAGAMQRVGNTSAKMPVAGVGVVPKMVGQTMGAAAPTVQAAGNKLTAGEKKLTPQATGGVPMLGMLPGLAGNIGRFLGGK